MNRQTIDELVTERLKRTEPETDNWGADTVGWLLHLMEERCPWGWYDHMHKPVLDKDNLEEEYMRLLVIACDLIKQTRDPYGAVQLYAQVTSDFNLIPRKSDILKIIVDRLQPS